LQSAGVDEEFSSLGLTFCDLILGISTQQRWTWELLWR